MDDLVSDPSATVGCGRFEIVTLVDAAVGSTTPPLANASGSLISLTIRSI